MTTATTTKGMWVANLVEPWRGESNSISVNEFFESIDEAVEMGRLSSQDKVRLALLKLRGVARSFYSAQPQLKADDVIHEEFRRIYVDRFKPLNTKRRLLYLKPHFVPRSKHFPPRL